MGPEDPWGWLEMWKLSKSLFTCQIEQGMLDPAVTKELDARKGLMGTEVLVGGAEARME